MIVKFKKTHPKAVIPIKGSEEAACYDVYATSVDVNRRTVTYGIGWAMQIPKGWKGVIVPRSNLTKHNWTMVNSPGQIDSDYRGEVMVKLTSLTNNLLEPLPYGIGDRIAQIYFERVNDVDFEIVEDFNDVTERGTGGFGSTGLS